MPEPGDAITWREACSLLGVGMRRVGQLIAGGELTRGPRWQHRQLSRAEVEQLALRRWNPRTAGPDSYWLARSCWAYTGLGCVSSWPLVCCRSSTHRTGMPSDVSSWRRSRTLGGLGSTLTTSGRTN
jgi:hypothetical protein